MIWYINITDEQTDRQTDRQTDKQTDGRTIYRSISITALFRASRSKGRHPLGELVGN